MGRRQPRYVLPLAPISCIGRLQAATPGPFFDYDCVSVVDPLTSWDELHAAAIAELRRAEFAGVWPRPPPSSGHLVVEHTQRALCECPLGVLYLAVSGFPFL